MFATTAHRMGGEMTQSNFEALAELNVNEHTEKKGNFTFLSWPWAHDYLAKLDPDFDWWPHDFAAESDGQILWPYMATPAGCFVRVTVRFKGKERTHTYPIIDHRNKSIIASDVSAMDVNTAIMRCFAKCCALHGLGLYIYAGEDLPQGPDVSKQAAHTIVVTNGKYQGQTLGELATKFGTPGLGYVKWMVSGHPDPVMREKAQEVWEAHAPELTDSDITDQLTDADCLDEITGLWRLLDSDQQAIFKPQFAARKLELKPENRDAAEARG